MFPGPTGLMIGGTKTKQEQTGWILSFSLQSMLWKSGFTFASSP